MANIRKRRIEEEAQRLERKYGHNAGATGAFQRSKKVIPTGILALDYALGTGGYERGHMVEVFGPPDIGKSSVIAFSGIKEAQKMGLTCGIVALEPGFDPGWAAKNGVDLDELIIGWPDDGQEAFEILHDWVTGDLIEFIVFDSIGAVLRPSEADVDGKPSQGGQAGLITWGAKRCLMPAWKNDKLVMFLNQVRDKMDPRFPMLDSPGGHALKHSCAVRIQLKPGKDRYTAKIDGEDVMIGRAINAVILRNKLAEGTGKRALFDHYSVETDDAPFGVDRGADIINTGMRTGVIQRAGAWYRHAAFPNGQLMGVKAAKEFLDSEEGLDAAKKIRSDILKVMHQNQLEKNKLSPNLEVVND